MLCKGPGVDRINTPYHVRELVCSVLQSGGVPAIPSCVRDRRFAPGFRTGHCSLAAGPIRSGDDIAAQLTINRLSHVGVHHEGVLQDDASLL